MAEIDRLVSKRLENGEYAAFTGVAALTKELRKDFREVTGDGHIWIDAMENVLLVDSGASPEEIAAEKSKDWDIFLVHCGPRGPGKAIAITSEATVISSPVWRVGPSFRGPKPMIMLRSAASDTSTTRSPALSSATYALSPATATPTAHPGVS